MKPIVRFRTHLALLVLATAVPLVVYIGYLGYTDAQDETLRAEHLVARASEAMARDAGARFQQARQHLALLGRRRDVRTLDASSCDPFLGDFLAMWPHYASVATLLMDGTIVCRALGRPVDGVLPVRRSDAVVREFSISTVRRGELTGRWVVRVGMPLEDDLGEQKGSMYLTLDMVSFSPDAAALDLPPQARMCIVDERDVVVASSVDAADVLGRPVSQVEPCADGVGHFRSIATLPGIGWRAIVQLPIETVTAPALERLRSSVVVSLLVGALAALLAFIVGRRTLRPVEAIAAASRRAANVSPSPHAMPPPDELEHAPKEIRDLAADVRQMLRARAEAEQALRVNESRLDAVIQNLDEGIDVYDLNGRLLRRNAAADRIFPSGFVTGARFDAIREEFEVRTMAGVVVPSDEWPVARLLRGESINGEEMQVVRVHAGEMTVVRLSGALVREPHGDSVVFVAFTDITDAWRGETERAALETRVREAQKMESIGTLAGGIAHDFNNILAAILGNVSLARADLEDGHPALASLDQINRAGLRARNLVQQILAFSRRQPLGLEPQALQPLVRETMALLRATLPAQVEFELQLADEPVRINANATQIQQVLMNLCTNAWHAMEDRPGRVQIGVQKVVLDAAGARKLGLEAGPHAHLWVSDEGVGMDEATRAHIFEPFFTTKPMGHGTGLGLPVVHGIAVSHGGGIVVESEPGCGSTFRLFLPALADDVAARRDAVRAAAAVRGHGERVLYVDDDEVMVLMVERLLMRAGFQARCFHRPAEALAALRDRPDEVDVIVSDLNMPEISGLDVARAVRAIRPALPVVISSGFLSDELRAKLQAAGVAGMLQKEHTLEDLLPTILRVLAAAPVR